MASLAKAVVLFGMPLRLPPLGCGLLALVGKVSCLLVIAHLFGAGAISPSKVVGAFSRIVEEALTGVPASTPPPHAQRLWS